MAKTLLKSAPSKVKLQTVKLNQYIYHIGNPVYRKRIAKNGIEPYRGSQWLESTPIKGNAVFATNSDNSEDWFETGFDDDVWRIDARKISGVAWYEDPNFDTGSKHMYTKETIPACAVELFRKGTGKNIEGLDNPEITVKDWLEMASRQNDILEVLTILEIVAEKTSDC